MRFVKITAWIILSLAALGLIAFWTFAPAIVEKGKTL